MQEHKEFTQLISNELPAGWADSLPSPTPEDKGKATRLHSQDCLNALASVLPGKHPLPNPEPFSRTPQTLKLREMQLLLQRTVISLNNQSSKLDHVLHTIQRSTK